MKHTFVHSEKINGYLDVSYSQDGFITITDRETGERVRLHFDVIRLLNKSLRTNYKQKRLKTRTPL
jgi:hypothetical protein